MDVPISPNPASPEASAQTQISSPLGELAAPYASHYKFAPRDVRKDKQAAIERFQEICDLRVLYTEHHRALLATSAAIPVMLSCLKKARAQGKIPAEALSPENITPSTAHHYIEMEIQRLEKCSELAHQAPATFVGTRTKEARQAIRAAFHAALSTSGEPLLTRKHYLRIERVLTQVEAENSELRRREIDTLQRKLAERYQPLLYRFINFKLGIDPSSNGGDALQEAYLILNRCLAQYQPETGISFQAYLWPALTRRLWESLSEARQPIRVPSYIVIELIPIYELARQQFLVPQPSAEQIAEAANCSLDCARRLKETVELRDQALNIVRSGDLRGKSRNPRMVQFKDTEREESPNQAAARSELKPKLASALDILEKKDARLARILVQRFGLKDGQEMTLAAIGAKEGLTGERIRQLLLSAFALLKSQAKIREWEID